MGWTDIIQLILLGVGMGSIYAVMAMGFHIIYKATEVFNFAYGQLAVLGGLLAFSLFVTLRLNLWLTLVLILALGFLGGLVFERLAIRPLNANAHLSLIISTVAMGIILENVYLLAWTKEELPFPNFSSLETVTFKGITLPTQYFWVFALGMVSILAIQLFFHYSIMGKAIRASAANRVAALGVGISPHRMVAYSFALSSALAMLAGMVMAPLTFAGGTLASTLTVKGFTAAILGGIERPGPVVLGGFLLGIVESLTAGLISSQFKESISLGVLLFFFLLQPHGIFSGLWQKGARQWRSV